MHAASRLAILSNSDSTSFVSLVLRSQASHNGGSTAHIPALGGFLALLPRLLPQASDLRCLGDVNIERGILARGLASFKL
jgi:hypothetical protein